MFIKLFDITLPTISCCLNAFDPQDTFPAKYTLPFGYDDTLPDLLIHPFDLEHLKIADECYQRDSSSAIVNTGGHHQAILDNFLSAFHDHEDGGCQKDSAILEIGCGQGLVLAELHKQGFTKLTGCEAVQYPLHKKLSGVRFVHNNFAPGIFEANEFDCIISKTAFEHIPNILPFFQEMNRILKDDGQLFFSVPNCEVELRIGDPRLLSLTHWNYFTTASLTSSLAAGGFHGAKITKSPVGDFYVQAFKHEATVERILKQDQKTDPIIINYSLQLKKNLAHLQGRIDRVRSENGSIAIYGVDFNLASILDWNGCPLRMIDSDEKKWGLYYANQKGATIFSPQSLLTEPPQEVWIAPIHYDSQIRGYLERELKLSNQTKIVSLKAVYSENALAPE